MDPLAGNQRAYRLADHDADSISPRTAAAGWIYRRVAARANRSALPGCWGRPGGAIFGSEAADTNGVRAAGFTNGANTQRAPLTGAWALDHRSGQRSLDACHLYENKSGQDVCGRGLSDERLDAAGTLPSGPPNYENCARREAK